MHARNVARQTFPPSVPRCDLSLFCEKRVIDACRHLSVFAIRGKDASLSVALLMTAGEIPGLNGASTMTRVNYKYTSLLFISTASTPPIWRARAHVSYVNAKLVMALFVREIACNCDSCASRLPRMRAREREAKTRRFPPVWRNERIFIFQGSRIKNEY